MANTEKTRNYTPLIVTITIVIYALVAILSYLDPPAGAADADWTFLPLLNAIFNSFTFIFLLAAWFYIKKGNTKMHRNFIIAAFGSTTLFLLCYVTYHFLTESTSYGGDGFLRYVYYFVLFTHIVLAAVIVPLALVTAARGLNNRNAAHRKIARWAMPLWLYVSLTGVLVYILIAPYY
jgi:putative membrane protein